ncbi:MAG TPA: DUF255 domain-containing protein [Ignavibacteria bacterium]|nr:DUF255 domain-containing protein [Ignavibacteria bacterium]
MNTKLLILIFALFSFANLSFSQTAYNFNDGLAQGKSQNKKILIEIYVTDNTWVDKMNETYKNPDVMNLMNSNFIFVRLDGNSSDKYNYNGKDMTGSEIAKSFETMSYPTHVFLNPDGTVISFVYNGNKSVSVPGYIDAEDFKNVLEYFRDGKYSSTDLSTIL